MASSSSTSSSSSSSTSSSSSSSASQQQRQLVMVVEGTAALGQSWTLLRSEYIDKIIRGFHRNDGVNQKISAPAGPPVEMALVVFYNHGPYSGCLVQQTGWTTNLDVFLQWLSCIGFSGGGFGEAAIAEGLAEALWMCCRETAVPSGSQVVERQKHCILVAASNPHRLPTPVPRPPIDTLAQQSSAGEPPAATHWWLADADTVAKAFSQCIVSLSVIAPRQLPILKSIYQGGKRNPHATDSVVDPVKYPHHMVLLSENFMEARVSLSQAAIANVNSLPIVPAIVPKSEPVSLPAISALGTIAGRPSGVIPSAALKMEVQPATTLAPAGGLTPVSLLQSSGAVPLSLQHQAPLPNQDQLQSNLATDTGGAPDFKNSVNSAMQTLRAAGIPGTSVTAASSISTAQNGLGTGQSGLSNSAGLGQGNITGGAQMASGVAMSHNVLAGLAGVASSGGGTMIPTPGLPQQVQGLSSLGVANNSVQNALLVPPVANGLPNALQQVSTTATPQQPAGSVSKYTKLWEGFLTGQRQGKPVPICRLEAYKQPTSPDTLASDWPATMQICRLIPQEHMNNKNYQSKIEYLIFRPLGEHLFLVQLSQKKLCAVIQLPSQTLLLASSDKPGRMIGMLFPGDMVVFKPQLPSNQQQSQSSSSQTFSQGQLLGQARPQIMQTNQLPGQGPQLIQQNQLPGQAPQLMQQNQLPSQSPQLMQQNQLPLQGSQLMQQNQLPGQAAQLIQPGQLQGQGAQAMQQNQLQGQGPQLMQQSQLAGQAPQLMQQSQLAGQAPQLLQQSQLAGQGPHVMQQGQFQGPASLSGSGFLP